MLTHCQVSIKVVGSFVVIEIWPRAVFAMVLPASTRSFTNSLNLSLTLTEHDKNGSIVFKLKNVSDTWRSSLFSFQSVIPTFLKVYRHFVRTNIRLQGSRSIKTRISLLHIYVKFVLLRKGDVRFLHWNWRGLLRMLIKGILAKDIHSLFYSLSLSTIQKNVLLYSLGKELHHLFSALTWQGMKLKKTLFSEVLKKPKN